MILQINDYKIRKEKSYIDLVAILTRLKQHQYKQASISDLDLINLKLDDLQRKGYTHVNGSNIKKVKDLLKREVNRILMRRLGDQFDRP